MQYMSNVKCWNRRKTMLMSARQIGHRLPILSRWRIHDSQNRSTVINTSCFGMNFGMELTPRCGWDLCSAAIISRAVTGTVGSRKFQLPLWVASYSVHGSPRPTVTLTLTWPRTFIMLHFATHAHDVPAFSSPGFSSPAFSVPPSAQLQRK